MHRIAFVEQEIRRLQVTVDDTGGMRCVHRFCGLSKPAKRFCRRDPPGAEPVAYAPASLVFHDDVGTFLPVSDVVNGDDVGVPAEPRSQYRLAREALGNGRIRAELGCEHLDGDIAVELEVACEKDFGSCAATEHLEQSIARWKGCRHRGSLAADGPGAVVEELIRELTDRPVSADSS